VHALPLLLASVGALAIAPLVLRALAAQGHTRVNYRHRELPCPFGVLIVAAALLALIPLLLIERAADVAIVYPGLSTVSLYALGVACLGLIDDAYGSLQASPRGWRGHARAVRRGELSTGALKAGGSLGLALFATNGAGLSIGRWLLASAVLVLATNLFNLLDLRPGRAIKAFALLGVGLAAGAAQLRPLWTLGLFAGPALVAGVYELRERALLGDTGANLIGALAGLWIVLTLSTTGQAIALAALLIITVYGEYRSISALVERTPGLRRLDSLGRPS
jgi:UDP-N-acetylmuramyl pentapeptide phosphotransferase/UDP-N-acetylglucosamine-1-phosphate transferase